MPNAKALPTNRPLQQKSVVSRKRAVEAQGHNGKLRAHVSYQRPTVQETSESHTPQNSKARNSSKSRTVLGAGTGVTTHSVVQPTDAAADSPWK